MDRGRVVGLVERVAAFDPASADRDAICATVHDIAVLRSWLAAREGVVVAALGRVSSFPEKTLADTTRVPLREAPRVVERADTLAGVPALAEALDDGRIHASHVDAFTRGLAGLDAGQRPGLLTDAARLARVAETVDADRFAGEVRSTVDRVRAEEGLAKLERQRRDTRLRTWTDKSTGMWHLSGRFDPETALALHQQLSAVKERLFRERHPDTCPEDPIERDQHLAALALVALVTGAERPVVGRAEIVPVIDLTGDTATIDWGLPVELPRDVLERLLPDALISPVVLANGVVVHAPGRLDLGRTTRLANTAQRRALRALYETCAVPGCGTRFEHCKIHHVTWWRHGGPTDLANLLPVCVRHHTCVHRDGWALHLDAERTLTVGLPDGTNLTGHPNRRRRAPPIAA